MLPFLICLVLNFNSGFYKKGVLVMNRKDIIVNYLKSWFILDLLASFPYSWIINYEESDVSKPDDEGSISIFRTP
jgi:hypothetical protein